MPKLAETVGLWSKKVEPVVARTKQILLLGG
jgi:hypothetical protein